MWGENLSGLIRLKLNFSALVHFWQNLSNSPYTDKSTSSVKHGGGRIMS